jgi:hypothetical protein
MPLLRRIIFILKIKIKKKETCKATPASFSLFLIKERLKKEAISRRQVLLIASLLRS